MYCHAAFGVTFPPLSARLGCPERLLLYKPYTAELPTGGTLTVRQPVVRVQSVFSSASSLLVT